MNLSKCCFFFIVLFTGSVAQDSCPTRNVTATCTDKSCADTRTCRKVGRTCQCVDNCGWSCVRIGCEFFEAPENGNVIYDPVNRTVGSTATFSCSSGYVLSGNAQLECLETKVWNAANDVSCECNRDAAQVTALRRTCMKTCVTAADCLRDRPCVCDGVCGLSCIPTARENYCNVTLVQVDNTVVTLDPATLVFGTVATISCTPGHLPIGGTREIQRNCLGNGDWSDGSLTCIPSDACRNPPEIEHASHDVKLYYANGESLRYSCNSGYASGSNSYLRCVDGNWSEANIRCLGKSCGHPGDIDNGYFIGRVYSFPNSVTYECNEGFELNGRPTRNCQTTQEWDVIAPSCSPVQCPPLDAPENGRKDGSGTDYKDSVSFSCDQGFSLHGESVLICLGDGSWSADVPVCTDVCRNPPDIENASHDVKQSYANGERLRYSCNLGYVLGSNSYMQCVDGSWLEQVINCRAVQCPPLDTPVNGRKDGSGTGYNDRVRFSCDQGFRLNGESDLTCQSNGTWSADVPVCTSAVQCPALDTPVNGRKDGSGTGYNVRVEFSCDQGFSLNGESVLTCQSDVTWSSDVPVCTSASCDPTDLPYGDVDENKRTVQVIPEHELSGKLIKNGRYIRVKCPEGYELRGSRYMKCQEGEWTPYKRPSFPGRPPVCSLYSLIA